MPITVQKHYNNVSSLVKGRKPRKFKVVFFFNTWIIYLWPLKVRISNSRKGQDSSHLGDFYNMCRQGQCCSSPGGPPSLTLVSDRTGKFVWNTFPKCIPSKCLLQILGRGSRHKVNWALKATIESMTSLGSVCECPNSYESNDLERDYEPARKY